MSLEKFNRRGTGALLVLVAALLFGAFVTGLARTTLTGRVQRDGAALVAGERSRLAVQSALDEAAHQFSRQANAPGTPVFRGLRDGKAFEGKVPVPDSASLFGGKGPLESSSVRFDYEPTVSGDGPYGGGLVTFEAAAGSGWLGRDSRHGAATREVRVAPVRVPAPFDEVTLLVLDPFPGMLDAARANADLHEDIRMFQELRESQARLTVLLQRVRAHLDQAADVGPSFRARLERLPQRPLPEHPEYTSSVENRHHFIDPATVVASFEPVIGDLRELALPPAEVERMAADVEQAARRGADADRQLGEALRAILSLEASAIGQAAGVASDRIDETIEQVARLVGKSREAAAGLAQVLVGRSARYTAFTDRLVEYSGSRAQQVRGQARALFDIEGAWSRRAAFRFGSPEELRAFLARHRARGEGVRGIAYQAAASSPISLGELDASGHFALATPATVDSGSNPGENRLARLLVVASRFELSGPCRASAVCRRFQGTAAGRLSGQLLIEEVRSASDLAGAIESHRRSRKPEGASLQAVVSPWCIAGGIERGP